VRLVDGVFKLALNPANGQGIEIGLDDRLMHSLCRLIEQSARSADWDLPFFGNAAVQPPVADAASYNPPRHLLN
jgi:hypothetical protein